MTILQGFPMVPERTPITSDGHPPEDAGLSCVPASLCAGAMYLNGVHQLGGKYTPDSFHDAAYGEGYIGGMAAIKFIGYCQSLGIKLSSLQGQPPQLVQMAHEQIRNGHPVVFTIPNPYGNPDYTHVCVFFGESAGYLTAMDPWIAQAITRKDSEWANILLDNQIWIEERLMIDLSTPGIGNYFTAKDANTWLCKQTGKTIYGENLTFYRSCGYSALRGLDDLGLPLSEEVAIERVDPKFQPLAGKGITVKFYELGVTVFDPQNLVDRRPGGGRIYKAHLYNGGPGTDPLVRELQAQVAQLKQQVGVDPNLVANFQTARAIQAHQITQAAQALETALVQPIQ